MKHKNDCFCLLNELIDCICSTSEKNNEIFRKTYNHLITTLHREYFTPFDREDIYMIAVKLDCLYKSVQNINLFSAFSPLTDKIKEIIRLFDTSEKNKFRNIFNKITEYNDIKKEELLLYVPDEQTQKIREIIEKCNETVIQIEYTILKNS